MEWGRAGAAGQSKGLLWRDERNAFIDFSKLIAREKELKINFCKRDALNWRPIFEVLI